LYWGSAGVRASNRVCGARNARLNNAIKITFFIGASCYTGAICFPGEWRQKCPNFGTKIKERQWKKNDQDLVACPLKFLVTGCFLKLGAGDGGLNLDKIELDGDFQLAVFAHFKAIAGDVLQGVNFAVILELVEALNEIQTVHKTGLEYTEPFAADGKGHTILLRLDGVFARFKHVRF
jgi:hypothetical protein